MENTHEPIISKELFFKVNEEVMPLKERKDIPLGEDRKKGFCYCPHCGRVLQKSRTTVNIFLFCSRGKYDESCKEVKIMMNDLYSTLSDLTKNYIKTLIDVDEYVRKSKSKVMANQKLAMSLEDIEKEIEKLKQSTSGLYERYREEKFTKEEYLYQKQRISTKIEELQNNKMKIINGIGEKQEQEDWEQLHEKITRWKSQMVFAEIDLTELIARVDFIDEKTLRVKWKFMDNAARVLKYAMAGQVAG